MLLSAPHVFGNVVEPVIGVLGDAWDRRRLVRAGGVAFALAVALIAASPGFWPLLLALALWSPASGAFVGLSQATLMDAEPARRERNMARWALAGSVGMVAGPLLLGALGRLDVGWRATFGLLAALSALVVLVAWRAPLPPNARGGDAVRLGAALRDGARDALGALRRRAVVRWLVLLQCADLTLDVLYAYLALYFVDVVGASGGHAGLAVLVWTGVGLAGDALLLPLLERVPGLRWLRASALLVLVVFPAFLLVDGLAAKLALLALLGALNSGWYAVLQARLYAALPDRSATVLALGNVSGLAGALLPLGVGVAADAWGLGAAMWLLLGAPIAMLVGLPRDRKAGAGG